MDTTVERHEKDVTWLKVCVLQSQNSLQTWNMVQCELCEHGEFRLLIFHTDAVVFTIMCNIENIESPHHRQASTYCATYREWQPVVSTWCFAGFVYKYGR